MDKHSILRSLMSGIPFHEAMAAHDIYVHRVTLDCHGFVYKSKRGCIHLYLDESMSPEATRRAFFHELWHILDDMQTTPYYIGIDRHHDPREKHADAFYEEAERYMASLG